MMTRMRCKCYSELIKISSYEDRFEYLKLDGLVGDITFGGHRILNQLLYHSSEWRRLRNSIIIRDGGMDLAHNDYPIYGKIYIHHIEPITIDDILQRCPSVFDPENLISVSFETHNAIHYGDKNLLPKVVMERQPGDTCLWVS